jgi:hypothetical protein
MFNTPIRETFPGDCGWATSGTASRLRRSVTVHPTALCHMVVSFGLMPTCFFPVKSNALEVSQILYQRHRRARPHSLICQESKVLSSLTVQERTVYDLLYKVSRDIRGSSRNF